MVLKRNRYLFSASLERLIQPNIALLLQWGVPDIAQAAQLCSKIPRLLTYNNPERAKELLIRAEQLGVPPTSQMFKQAVAAVACTSKEKVVAKLEFFKRTLGRSESEAAMEPWYIVERPVLFAMSLEKRLVPRHYVMKVLLEKGLLNSNTSFFTLAVIGEETFKLKFIDCHKDSVPGLAHAFAADRAGIVPSRV